MTALPARFLRWLSGHMELGLAALLALAAAGGWAFALIADEVAEGETHAFDEAVLLSLRAPGPYRLVRHPLYVGWLCAFWATPSMSIAHLVFAVMTTVYILIAIRFEERDLVEALPGYAEYRERVPMLVPRLFR